MSEKHFNIGVAFSIAISAVIAVFAPRFLALWPAIIGGLMLGAFVPVFGRAPNSMKYPLGWIIALLVLSGLSTLWAHAPEVTQERTIKLIPLLILSCGVFALNPREVGAHFIKIFPWIFTLSSLLLSVEYFTNGIIFKHINEWPDPTKLQSGQEGVLNMSNYNRSMSVLIMMFLPAMITIRAQQKTTYWPILLIALGSMAFNIAHTQSQSAQLALLIGGAFYVLFPTRCKASWYGLSALFFIVFFALPWAIPYAFQALPDYIEGVYWFEHSYSAERLEIWDFIARKVQESPLFGFGTEATRAIIFDTDQLFFRNNSVLHPHNFALQFWIEFGALGAAFFTGFIVQIFLTLKNMPAPHAKLYGASVILVLSMASTSFGFWQGWWVGTLFMVAAACLLCAPILDQDISDKK